MSTRCNVEIYDRWGDEYEIGAMLYHHSDGYPEFMDDKLDRFLKATQDYLGEAGHPYWWDAERVAAVLITLSIEDYDEPLKPFTTDRPNSYQEMAANMKPGDEKNWNTIKQQPYRTNGGVPVFQPCLNRHGDIEYVWKVYLDKEPGKFRVEWEKV